MNRKIGILLLSRYFTYLRASGILLLYDCSDPTQNTHLHEYCIIRVHRALNLGPNHAVIQLRNSAIDTRDRSAEHKIQMKRKRAAWRRSADLSEKGGKPTGTFDDSRQILIVGRAPNLVKTLSTLPSIRKDFTHTASSRCASELL